MKRIYHFFLIFMTFCMLLFACSHTLVESEYSFGGMTIQRKDWGNVMTELIYYDRDGNEMGTALFHYPGRDGWFLVDNIWGYCDKIYLVMCDACPKLNIKDSAHFVVLHDYAPVLHLARSRWVRMSNADDAPVVVKKNKEYNSKIQKTLKKRGRCFSMPDWRKYPGEYFKGGSPILVNGNEKSVHSELPVFSLMLE